MAKFLGAFVLLIGAANSQQQYGPPGYTPGIPIGGVSQSPLSELLRAQEVSTSYGAPSGYSPGSGPSFGSYDGARPPSSPSSVYGPPGRSTGRFKIVPAKDYKLPEQHSNLIRYIVLKEFRVGPNGSYSQVDSRNQISGGGYSFGGQSGSSELEVMKVELPNSGEQSQINSVTKRPISITTSSGKDDLDDNNNNGGEDNNLDDEYDDDDQYDDDLDNNNSLDGSESGNSRQGGNGPIMAGVTNNMQVVPARGVSLNSGRRPAQSRPQSSETQAFMFSDPGSMETAGSSQSRQSTEFNTQPDIGTVVRNTVQNTRNRNRNRSQARRNRVRNRLNALNGNNNRNNNKNNAAQSTQNAIIPIVTLGNASMPPIEQLQDALGLISQYFRAQADLMQKSQEKEKEVSNLLSAPSSSVSVSSGGYSGAGGAGGSSGYQASGQPESGRGNSDANIVDANGEPCFFSGTCGQSDGSGGGGSGGGGSSATQSTFPASTYGPPPGSPGFAGNSAGGSAGGGGGASPFGNIAQTLTGGVRQVAGFKSALLNQVVNGFTATLRNAGSAGSSGGSSSGTPSSGYGAPAADPITSGSPVALLRGIGGGVVTTLRNSGRAAVGIVGTKGKLVVDKGRTATNLVTKGVSQTVGHKHEAFQSVIKHIQSIFNSNPALLNNGNW